MIKYLHLIKNLYKICQYPELLNTQTQTTTHGQNYQDNIGILCTYHREWTKSIIWIALGEDPYLKNSNRKNAFTNCSPQDIPHAQQAINEGIQLWKLRNIHLLSNRRI